MNQKTYRNIYFYGSSMKEGSGYIDVYYTGSIFNNAKYITNFEQKYDDTKDLYIICNDCASKKYRKFIKVNKN